MDKLKSLRKSRKLTQSEFAQAINKSPRTIWNWEKGFTDPTLPEALQIAQFFEVDLTDLVDDPQTSAVA